MHRLTIVCWCLAACCGTACAAEPIKLHIVTDDAYPPYSYAEQGEARGIYPAIIRKALARMPEFQLELTPVPWKRGLKMLETGEEFALAPPYFRPAERPYMDYSVAMLDERVVLFCNAALAATGRLKRWPDDFTGLRIGMNAGFLIGGTQFRQAIRQGKMVLEEARGTSGNLRKVLLGRLDCYMNDRYAVLQELSHIRQDGSFRASASLVEVAQISEEHGYLGYTRQSAAKFSFKEEFARQFDAAISDMKRSGEIEQIVAAELRR